MAEQGWPKCDVDPVCMVDLKKIPGRYTYDFEEQVYYFCSELCRDQFAAEPQKYLKKEKD
ncbi:MAG TPA: YHS domain-containing protein [Desulfobaccales bacterium]|jgi:YHS domain-containing protein